MASILLVEDEENFGMVLKNYLELHDHQVTWCKDGIEGLKGFRKGHFNLCILDVMMPEKDGFTLANDIRKTSDVPLIFLTAKSQKEDILNGYRSGADDYLTKPFDSDVLLMKVQAILSRHTGETEASVSEEFNVGQSLFNARTRWLNCNGTQHKLSPKEAHLFTLLCRRRNDVLTREEALNTIWDDDSYFSARSMDVFIAKLRKLISADPSLLIENIHGNGYRLVARE